MKRIFLLTAIVFAAAVSAARAQEDGFKPIPNLPQVTKDLIPTLKASGSYKTLIIVIGKVGLENLGLTKNSNGQITLFAPNDAAFAKLPKQQFDALMKDPQKMKNLLLLHAVKGKVSIADLLVPTGEGTKTYKELKSLQGRVMGFQCDGHTGEHRPRIAGGKGGMIGKGDVSFDRGVVHEIDEVMASDYLFAAAGPK